MSISHSHGAVDLSSSKEEQKDHIQKHSKSSHSHNAIIELDAITMAVEWERSTLAKDTFFPWEL